MKLSSFSFPAAILSGLCVFGLWLAPVQAETSRPAPAKNFLFISVDDMNWDSTGIFGCPIPDITPNIDRLASQGMRFEHSHVSIAICQPTRATWMTGRYPHRSGALGFNKIDPGVPTLLETLADAGFQTGILGKVEHVVPSRGEAWNFVRQASELGNGRDPKRYYEESLAFLQEVKAEGKRFFLMANTADPHRPFAGSLQERQKKKRGGKGNKNKKAAEAGEAEDLKPLDSLPAIPRAFSPAEVPVPGFLPDIPDVRQELSEYFASVHRADLSVGEILRALDESGLADETLVIFLSDHGMPLPFAKTNCYYNSTRTPWIVRWPGVVEANAFDQKHFISGIDITPTALEALGLPPMEGVDGHSILPVLLGQSAKGRDFVWTHINSTAGKNNFPMRAIDTAKLGYIYNAWANGGKTVFKNESQSGLTMRAMQKAAASDPGIASRVDLFLHRMPEELYDYESDPAALHNLIDDPAHAEDVKRFREQMRSLMKATDDPELTSFEENILHLH